MNADVQNRPTLIEDLKLALVFGALGGFSVLLVFPYLLATMPQAFAKVPVSLPVIALLQAAQGLVVLTLLSWVGLRLAYPVGLGSPWLRAVLFGRPRPVQPWLRAICMGLAAGIAILALSPVFDAHMPAPLQRLAAGSTTPAPWLGFLASFYGGIVEEIVLRLFAMSLVLWIVAKLSRRAPTALLFWLAVLLAALLFGIGHLPAAAKIWPLDAIVIVRTIALNAVGGLVFGWLYWKQGLESAMLGHFSADLVLHVAAPFVAGVLM